MTFGEKLRELRTARGLTQDQLADVSDVPVGTIRDYEQNKREPLLTNAQKLARALEASLDVFPGPERDGVTAGMKRKRPKRGRKGREK